MERQSVGALDSHLTNLVEQVGGVDHAPTAPIGPPEVLLMITTLLIASADPLALLDIACNGISPVLSRRIVYSIYYNSTLLLPVRGEGKGC